jgi:thiol:disulfide interchange protein DsbD
MDRRSKIFFLLILVLGMRGAELHAAPVSFPHGTVELLSESQSLQPGRSSTVGIHFRLEQGWHIYWINPGDAGEPPRAKWGLPAGLTAGEIQWPTPKRLEAFSAVDYGYEDEVLLLVPVQAIATLKPEADVTLQADLRFVVCHDVCMAGRAEISLTLPVKREAPAFNPATRELFQSARGQLPKATPAAWKFSVTSGKDTFLITAILGRPVQKAYFFPLVEDQIENAAPRQLHSTKTGFQMTLPKSDRLLKPISHLKGVWLLESGQSYLVDMRVK